MVGANPKSESYNRANLARLPGAARYVVSQASRSGRLRWLPLLCALIPLSFTLAQCGQAPSAGSLAANVQGTTDTFDDRFPQPQFKDRFPTTAESLAQRPASTADAQSRRMVQTQPVSYRVASLEPTVPYQRQPREDQTTLVGLKSSKGSNISPDDRLSRLISKSASPLIMSLFHATWRNLSIPRGCADPNISP